MIQVSEVCDLQTLAFITQGISTDHCHSISVDVCTKQWIGFHNIPKELNVRTKFVIFKEKNNSGSWTEFSIFSILHVSGGSQI